jgi:hypothetical protein
VAGRRRWRCLDLGHLPSGSLSAWFWAPLPRTDTLTLQLHYWSTYSIFLSCRYWSSHLHLQRFRHRTLRYKLLRLRRRSRRCCLAAGSREHSNKYDWWNLVESVEWGCRSNTIGMSLSLPLRHTLQVRCSTLPQDSLADIDRVPYSDPKRSDLDRKQGSEPKRCTAERPQYIPQPLSSLRWRVCQGRRQDSWYSWGSPCNHNCISVARSYHRDWQAAHRRRSDTGHCSSMWCILPWSDCKECKWPNQHQRNIQFRTGSTKW